MCEAYDMAEVRPKSEHRNIQPLVIREEVFNKTLALYCVFFSKRMHLKDGTEFEGIVESEETGWETSPTKDSESEFGPKDFGYDDRRKHSSFLCQARMILRSDWLGRPCIQLSRS